METNKEILADLIEYARFLQENLCSYGTKDGDGKSCKCKFSKNGKMRHMSESGCGCAEARAILWGLERLECHIEQKDKEHKERMIEVLENFTPLCTAKFDDTPITIELREFERWQQEQINKLKS